MSVVFIYTVSAKAITSISFTSGLNRLILQPVFFNIQLRLIQHPQEVQYPHHPIDNDLPPVEYS